MAVYLYYGKIGDGKTYHVLKNEVVPAARKGRRIYSNIDGLSDRRLLHYVGREVDLVQWSGVEEVRAALQLEQDDKEGRSLKVQRGSLLVVDEAQMCFDSRNWKDTGPAVLRFFEYHRHFGLDIVLITQSPGRLDKALVRLSNEALHVKNLRFLGSWAGSRYVVNVRQTPYDRECMATMRGHYDTDIFGLYRSAVMNSRARVSKAAMSKVMLLIPAAIAVVIILGIRNGGLSVLHGQAGKVMVPNESVAAVGSASIPESAAMAHSAAAIHAVQGVQPKRVVVAAAEGDTTSDSSVEDEEPKKVRAVLRGTVEKGDVVEYYLTLPDGITKVVTSLAEYEIVGKL